MKKSKVNYFYDFLFPLIVALILMGMLTVTQVAFRVAWLLFFVAICKLFWNLSVLAKKRRDQVLLIGTVAWVFQAGALYHGSVQDSVLRVMMYAALVFMAAALLRYAVQSHFSFVVWSRSILNKCREHKAFLVILLLFLAGSVPVLKVYPMYDAGCYANALQDFLQRFDFGAGTNLLDFYMFGHADWAYGFWLLFGGFLFPKGTGGYMLMVVAAGVLAICMLYRILNFALPKEAADPLEKAMMTGVFAFSPFFFGMEADLSLDIGLMCFFVVFLYFYLKDEWLMAFIMELACCFTKEPAVIILPGFFAAVYLRRLWIGRADRKALFSGRNITKLVLDMVPLVLWVVIFKWRGSDMWSAASDMQEIDFWGIDATNITMRLKEFLLLNFNWLLLLVVLAVMLRKKSREAACRNMNPVLLLGVLGAGVFNFGFYMVFFTVTHARYVCFLAIVYAVLLAAAVTALHSARLRKAVLAVVCVLFFVQSLIGIDPVTKHVFQQLKVGQQKITCLTYNKTAWINDSIIYNRDYTVWRGMLQEMLKETKADGNTVYVVSDASMAYTFMGSYRMWWNPDTQTLAYSDTAIPVDVMYLKDGELTQPEQNRTVETAGKRLIYISAPWRQNMPEEKAAEAAFVHRYGMQKTVPVSYHGWELTCYETK